MKEAFWGVLIVILGLFGIVIVNIFQKVTVSNDEVYYLTKETTEAAMYDAIDLGYYRLNGDVRIVEDKFVENFTRRFAENVTSYTNYNINIEDINELPPKVSLSVRTSITSLKGDTFGITNRVDAIIETKYKLSDVIDFLGITEEEWLNRENVNSYYTNKEENGETACKITTKGSEEYECIPGDIEFSNWEDISLTKTTCDTDKKENRTRIATYKVCECGKWKEEKEEIESIIVNNGNEYIYKWIIEKEGEIRDIKEETKIRVIADKCVTGIDIYVPKDLREKEPSSDNSKYEKCPKEGIRIPKGDDIVIHGGYTPSDATNRNLTWKSSGEAITLQSSNPNTTTGYSKAGIIAKEIGNTTVTATSTNKVAGTCKIEVWDGNVDSVGCTNETLQLGSKTTVTMKIEYEPYNSTKTNFTWTSSNTGVATIDNNGNAKAVREGTTTITVTAPNGKTGTCTITVNQTPSTPPGGGTTTVGNCSYTQVNEAVAKKSVSTGGGFIYEQNCSCPGSKSECIRPYPKSSPMYGRCQKAVVKCTYCWHKEPITTTTVYTYMNIEYTGSKKVQKTIGICKPNGTALVSVVTYCEGSRSKNVDNPNLKWNYTISRSNYTIICGGLTQ